jgi:hypothetical protein
MKYTVDDNLRSLCRQIAAMNLSPDERIQEGKKTLVAGPWESVFFPFREGYFVFSIKGLRDYTYDARMTLEEVLKIHQGVMQEIEIQPRGGIHPEDAGMRRIEVDAEILFNAINDGINEYVKEVLVPRGLVNMEAYDNTSDLVQSRHKIAKHFATHWKISWRNEP